MEVQDIILADYAEVNPQGKFTVVGGGFTAIGALKVPFVHPVLFVLLRLKAALPDAGKNRFNVQIVGQQGTLAKMDFNVDVNKHPQTPVYRALPLRFVNVNFEHEGEYQVEVRINGVVKFTQVLLIKLLKKPE